MPVHHPLHSSRDVDEVVEEVFALFRRRGYEEYHGEAVSQLEHAYQAAEIARSSRPADPEFILAAFLHDIGHLCTPPEKAVSMDGYGMVDHETLGARYLLARGFSSSIAKLVAQHVEAKRYLVATDKAYFAALSEASRITLEKQGGPMSPEEVAAFETDPQFGSHLQLRRIDEQAKVAGRPAPDLFWLEMMLRKHLLQRL